MARLETADGGWFELSPTDYEFQHVNGDEYDDNWLHVEFAASLEPAYSVSRTSAPAFLNWELQAFVQSSREFIEDTREKAALDGIEPNLALEVRRSSVDTMAVKVAAALSFAPYLREPFDEPFVTTVEVHRRAFSAFIAELGHELDAFPERRTPT